MLKLDERKIRKGRPVGLPWIGGKKKVVKKLIEIIKQNFSLENRKVYDIFGGGGAITFECLINDIPVHYNDRDENVSNMILKVNQSDRDYLKTLIVNREDFARIKEKENKNTDDNLKLLVNSFGYNMSYYLYSKEYSDIKYNLAKEIIKNEDVFLGYKQTDIYKNAIREVNQDELEVYEQLQRLQQLENLVQVQRLREQDRIKDLTITNCDYKEFSYLNKQVIYLDPPYKESVIRYKYGIDYENFANWVCEMAKRNIVLISGYKAPDERFEMVYEFKTARSTMAGGNRKDKKRTERLFMVKGGLGYERTQ